MAPSSTVSRTCLPFEMLYFRCVSSTVSKWSTPSCLAMILSRSSLCHMGQLSSPDGIALSKLPGLLPLFVPVDPSSPPFDISPTLRPVVNSPRCPGLACSSSSVLTLPIPADPGLTSAIGGHISNEDEGAPWVAPLPTLVKTVSFQPNAPSWAKALTGT